MIEKKGAIAADKFNNYTWPVEWVNGWKDIVREGVSYKVISILDEPETAWAQSQFDFINTPELFDSWMAAELIKQAQTKGLAAWNALLGKVPFETPYSNLTAFSDSFSPVRQAINLGRLQDAKAIAAAIPTTQVFTEDLKSKFLSSI